MHITDEKKKVRDAMKERLEYLPETQRSAESRSLCRRLLEAIPAGGVTCAYAAMRNEAQLDLFIEEILKRGDVLFLPRFENTQLVFRQCIDLESLIKGPLGGREPPKDAPLLPQTSGITVIVPGVAFDRQGNRLGRGNGGYDRWIAERRKKDSGVRFIGAALECQLIAHVPAEPHDQHMNEIVTARELLEINREKKT